MRRDAKLLAGAVGSLAVILFAAWLLMHSGNGNTRPASKPQPVSDASGGSKPSPPPVAPDLDRTSSQKQWSRGTEAPSRPPLSVIVVGPDDSLLDNVSLSLRKQDASGTTPVPITTSTLENGSHQVSVEPSADNVFGEPWPVGASYWLKAEAGELGHADLELAPGQLVARIRIRGLGKLTIAADDYDPAAWECVLAARLFGAAGPASATTQGIPLDPQGRAVFEDLTPGPHELRIMALGGEARPGAIPVAIYEAEVPVHYGPQDYHVELGCTLTLTVFVPGGSEGESVALAAGTNPWPFAQGRELPSNLTVTFEHLRQGRYVLQCGGSNPGMMPVELSSNTTLQFAPQGYTELEIVMKDEVGVLGRAGFRDGDRIITINNQTFRDASSMAAAYASSTTAWQYGVLRAGRTLEIPLDREQVTSVSCWGGLLRPVW